MRLKEQVVEGVDVFALEGDIDMHFSPVLRDLFQGRVKEKCPALVLDFSGVEFIDSRGIATILEYLRDCADFGGKLCLAALSREIKPIIVDTVRLDKVMPIFMTVPEAITAMKDRPEVQASR